MAISTRDLAVSEDPDTPTGPADGEGAPTRRRSLFNRKRKANDDWLDEVEEEPRSGTTIGQRLARRERWTRWYLIVCAILTPLLLISLLASVTAGDWEPEEDDPTVGPGRVRAEAAVAVEDWLTSGASPISNGKILQWDSTTDLPTTEANEETGEEAGLTMQAVSFVVNQPDLETGTSTLYQVEVLVASYTGGEVTTVGDPSVVQLLPAVEPDDVDRWPTLEEDSSPSNEVVSAVENWADAYTSGSAQQLRAVINDNDTSRTYVPYSKMRLNEVTVGEAAVVKTTDPEDENEEPVPTRIVVAVTLVMTDRAKDCDRCPDPVAEFDVLVDDANTVTPQVVAWGSPGTGAVMEPYQNAIPTTEKVNRMLEQLEAEATNGQNSDGDDTDTEVGDTDTDPTQGTGKNKRRKKK